MRKKSVECVIVHFGRLVIGYRVEHTFFQYEIIITLRNAKIEGKRKYYGNCTFCLVHKC